MLDGYLLICLFRAAKAHAIDQMENLQFVV
jgi:hypothetical protein